MIGISPRLLLTKRSNQSVLLVIRRVTQAENIPSSRVDGISLCDLVNYFFVTQLQTEKY